MKGTSHEDRRQFRRVHAPVTCRAAGMHPRAALPQQPIDISLGGLRIYATKRPERGAHLQLELFIPGGDSVACTVEVVWVEQLPKAAPAPWDVGLRFVAIAPADQERLGRVLDDGEDSP